MGQLARSHSTCWGLYNTVVQHGFPLLLVPDPDSQHQLMLMNASQNSPCIKKCMQAAFAMWQLMVQLAVRAPTSNSPASNAAKWSLFSGVVAPVLQALLFTLPAAHDKPGGQTSCLWPQVHFFLFACKSLLQIFVQQHVLKKLVCHIAGLFFCLCLQLLDTGCAASWA